MDYELLKQADATLGILDPAQAAEALNAQTTTPVFQDIPTEDARSVLLGTLQYGALVLLSQTRYPTAEQEPLVKAAIEAVTTLDKARVIQWADDTKRATTQTMLGMFVAASVITQSTADAMAALGERRDPVWPVTLTEHDILAARSL